MTVHPTDGETAGASWNGKPAGELLRKIEAARETGRALYLVRRQMEEAISALDAEAAAEAVRVLDMPDVTDPRFIEFSSSWDCPGSPTGLCIYYGLIDFDYCLFCDEPKDRG